MRSINSTIVNVQVIDRQDRTNVVATLRGSLRHWRLFMRGTCLQLAKQMRKLCQEATAKPYAMASSPSLGGHSTSGGPGLSRSS